METQWRVCIPDPPKLVQGKILGGGDMVWSDMWTMKVQGHNLVTEDQGQSNDMTLVIFYEKQGYKSKQPCLEHGR